MAATASAVKPSTAGTGRTGSCSTTPVRLSTSGGTTIQSVEEIRFGSEAPNQTIALGSDQLQGAGTDLGAVTFDHADHGRMAITLTGPDVNLSGWSFQTLGPDHPSLDDGYFATIEGTSTAESIEGSRVDDQIQTGGGGDTVRAGDGDDLVRAASADALRGGPGTDTVDYSARSFADASINLAAGKVYQQGWLKTASPNPLSGNPRIHTLSQFENVRGASGGQHDPGR